MNQMTPSHLASAPLAGLRVLIADDSAACRSSFGAAARALGAEVALVETGEEAKDAFDAERFDLVVVDLGLPDVDGRELIRALRSFTGVNPAILCVSGLGGGAREASALAAGADVFAEKPFSRIADFAVAAQRSIRARTGAATEPLRAPEDEPARPPLSPEVAAFAHADLSRAAKKLRSGVASGDVDAVRRAAHFLSGVAALVGDRTLERVSRLAETKAGGGGVGLRTIEAMLGLAQETQTSLASRGRSEPRGRSRLAPE